MAERKKGDPTSVIIEVLRKQKSLRIVNSILTFGLLSRLAQHDRGIPMFTSEDGLPTDDQLFPEHSNSLLEEMDNDLSLIHIKLVIPSRGKDMGKYVQYKDAHTKRITVGDYSMGIRHHFGVSEDTAETVDILLNDALYNSINGVLAVTEREDSGYWPTKDYANRITHCMLVVMRSTVFKKEDFARKLNGHGEVDADSFPAFEYEVPPSKIDSILMPGFLLKELQSGIQPTAIPLIPVGEITRNGNVHPDYESAVRQLLEETGEPLFLHGVRLPTTADIRKELKREKEMRRMNGRTS